MEISLGRHSRLLLAEAPKGYDSSPDCEAEVAKAKLASPRLIYAYPHEIGDVSPDGEGFDGVVQWQVVAASLNEDDQAVPFTVLEHNIPLDRTSSECDGAELVTLEALSLAPAGKHALVFSRYDFSAGPSTGFIDDRVDIISIDQNSVKTSVSNDSFALPAEAYCDSSEVLHALIDLGETVNNVKPPAGEVLSLHFDNTEGAYNSLQFLGWLSETSFSIAANLAVQVGYRAPDAVGRTLSTTVASGYPNFHFVLSETEDGSWDIEPRCSMEPPLLPQQPLPVRDIAIDKTFDGENEGKLLLDGEVLKFSFGGDPFELGSRVDRLSGPLALE